MTKLTPILFNIKALSGGEIGISTTNKQNQKGRFCHRLRVVSFWLRLWASVADTSHQSGLNCKVFSMLVVMLVAMAVVHIRR